MPKQLYKIVQFHGGLNSNSDARDIAEQELSDATDVMVDELGKIRMMGGTTAQGVAARANVITPGYGLFQFSHDRTGAGVVLADYSGTHTGGDHATIMTDSAATFPVDSLIGATINNTTDGSSGTITDNTATTVTATLSGGSDDSWDDAANDAYTITDFPETGDDYLAFSDSNTDGLVSIYSAGDTTWGDPITGMANNTGGTRKDTFFFVDGALRVCDGNFGNTNVVKWYGYIDRTQFPGLTGTAPSVTDNWVLANAELAAPTQGKVGHFIGAADADSTDLILQMDNETNGVPFAGTNSLGKNFGENIDTDVSVLDKTSNYRFHATAYSSGSRITVTNDQGDWDGRSVVILPRTPGAGFFIDLEYTRGDGVLGVFGGGTGTMSGSAATTFEFASTFIYDDEPDTPRSQESSLKIHDGAIPIPANQIFGDCTIICHSPYAERITGGRIYSRIRDESADWNEIVTMSLNQGIRSNLETAYTSWANADTGGVYSQVIVIATVNITSLGFKTYESNTGLTANETSSTAKFKTAVIANRVAYLGNVEFDSIRYGDSIFQSVPNKFDGFSKSKELAASINDGDEIVKLEHYSDRLLQFKKNKLQIINISQYGSEFLEETLTHKGVIHPAATCKTDFGIAWVNRQGCYLFDGQKISNLLEKKGRQIIKESDWLSFTTDNSIIGYVPKKRQIIVLKDCTATSVGDIYLFDMVTQSWVKGDSKFTDSQIQTNFVTDWNSDLVNIHTSATGTIEKWDDAGDDSTAFVIQTKDIDFGNPAQKKKIYKVYVTYTGVSSLSVNVDYQINGDNGWNGFASGEPLTASSGQNEATLTLSSPVECYSFQLKFSGTGKTTFEINDATIVFRLKGMR